MTLVKFNSDRNHNSLSGINNVFDSILNDTFFSDRMISRVPGVNISESTDHYHVEMAAPGLKKEDFKLKLERDVLSISVEQIKHDNDQERNYAKREYSYSSFVRSFTLPDSSNVDGIIAKYEQGILKIDIPKREEAKITTREIEIR